jgi:hypothetical protein
MAIEGEIEVTLHWDGRRAQRVTVRSTRPSAAARIAVGRRPADAARLLPTLYAVCGHAQRAAATAALRAAGGDVDPSAHAAVAVQLEAVQESFWRLLIDVPRALGLATEAAPVAAARACVARALEDANARPAAARAPIGEAATALAGLARDHVFGRAAATWLAETDLGGYDRWRAAAATLPARALAQLAEIAPGLGRSDTPPMPDLEAGGWTSLARTLQRDPAFAGAPTWDGVAVETGPLSRLREHRLIAALTARDGRCASTRIVARLVELARLLEALQRDEGEPSGAVRAWPVEKGSGIAAVQTARGVLLHLARIDDDRIDDYRIVAPTDWNFHPDGALARGLVGLEADDAAALAQRAGLAALALDPCVAFRIEVAGDA